MTTDERYDVLRRDVLKTIGMGAAVGAVGFAATGSARAASHINETIYLSHSTSSAQGNVTILFTVDLDSGSGNAVLTEVTRIGAPFQNVDAIAATADGSAVSFVDRNTSHLGIYDVGSGTFDDKGQIAGLPNLTVLGAYSLDGTLYVASNGNDTLYTVDETVSPPVANAVGKVQGVDVNGADIVFDSNGTLFLHSNSDDTLYTVDYQNPVSGEVAATAVGQDAGSSLTGLAVRDAGQGDLVGSSRADDAIIVLDKGDGSRTASYPMTLNGSSYAYTNGDMATGNIIDETCVACESEELLAKYEFACLEEDPETGECVAYDFVFEKGDESLVSYTTGDFESKEGEDWEPISATFETEYCAVYAVVKAGQEFEIQALSPDDGRVTAEYVAPYAISFVAFFCTQEAAQAFVDDFPSKGKGKAGRPE